MEPRHCWLFLISIPPSVPCCSPCVSIECKDAFPCVMNDWHWTELNCLWPGCFKTLSCLDRLPFLLFESWLVSMLKLRVLVRTDLLPILPCGANGDLPRLRTGVQGWIMCPSPDPSAPESVFSLAVISDILCKVSLSLLWQASILDLDRALLLTDTAMIQVSFLLVSLFTYFFILPSRSAVLSTFIPRTSSIGM